jgi:Nucleotidyltransferase domain
MAAYTFPGDTFTIQGDPEAVYESGRADGRFATTAAEAAADLRGLHTGAWVGSEGDLFRARVAELPPHLDTAQHAFSQVARALAGFADALAAAQRQMAAVRADAEQTFGALQDARAHRSRLREPSDEQTAADAAAQAAYYEHTRALDIRIGRLETTWEDHLAAAGGVRARLLEAARHTAGMIRAAGRTSPTANRNRLETGWENVMRAGGKAVEWVLEQQMGFLRGFGEGVVGIGQGLATVAPFSPLFWLIDPDGQRQRSHELAQGVRFSVEHPTEVLKAVANWEDLGAGRFGEWLGNFGPDALLAAATAGAGGVAAGASRGARAADAVGDLAEAARQADRAAPPTARTVPMGVTASRFEEMGHVLRRATGHLDGELLVHGSRASGTAHAGSDIDIVVRVAPETFDDVVRQRFGTPSPGSAKERTMLHAVETGKIQAGEAGLRATRRELEQLLGMPVDISVTKRGGAFDQGPYIPIP